MVRLVRVVSLVTLASSLGSPASVRAQDADPPVAIEAMGLPRLAGKVVVFHSEGCGERAAYLQELATVASRFLARAEALGIELDLTLAVLDPGDWARVSKPPYGISHIRPDSPMAILPASTDNVLARGYSAMKDGLSDETLDRFRRIGVPFEEAIPRFVDLIGLHEIGHIYSREYGTWPKEKWLSEFIATYLAYAVMAEHRPDLAGMWDAMCDALGAQSGIEHRSLADFERLYMGVGNANYGWYQGRFQRRVREVHESLGMTFMHRLRESLETTPESAPDDTFRIRELEVILEGLSSWARGEEGALESPPVRIHYLGHAAFVLQLGPALTVVTDLGQSRAYDLDSPVHELGSLVPDVATFSHRHHVDHDGKRLPPEVAQILTGTASLSSEGVSIEPIRTFESSLDEPDNTSYLFRFGGISVLHLGDVQALITASDRPDVARKIRRLYPDSYDVVLLPIGFTRDIVAEAVRFARLLDAGTVIPMHYWSPKDREAFAERMEGERRPDRGAYAIERPGSASAIVTSGRPGETRVLLLDPAPWPD